MNLINLQTFKIFYKDLQEIVKYKKFNNLTKAAVFGISIWLICFVISIFADHKYAMDHYFYVARIEFVVNIITLFILFSIYKEAKYHLNSQERHILFYFIATNVWVFVVDILFYIAAYAGNSFLQGLDSIQFILYYAPCIMFGFFMILFLSNIFIRDILLVNGFVSRIFILLLISLVTYALFLSAINYAYKVFSLKNILQVLLLFIEFILFDISIVSLIYSKNKSASIFLIGIIILVTGDFFLTYTYISQTTSLFILGEFLWFLGVLFLMFSIISIKENKHYFFNQWFRSDNTIRSRMGFGIFLTSIASFLLVFIISYILGLINNQVFINVPLILMFYSIIVVTLSIFTAKSLEVHFKKIENNIKLLTYNLNDEAVDNTFPITEFNLIQNILIDSFKFKEEKEQISKRFNNAAALVAHDINNPLNGVMMIMPKIKDKMTGAPELELLETYINQIHYITSDLLNYFRESTSNNNILNNINSARFILLEETINNILKNNKNWECDIDFTSDLFSWVYLTPMQLQRTITNLINNAYESLTNKIRNISIKLSNSGDIITLTIQDTGCGIAQGDNLDVLNGKSLKHIGVGLGLSSAVEYFKSIKGNLLLQSTLNIGTKITIKIPQSIPSWFKCHIDYNDITTFIIIEKNVSTLSYLQQLLIELDNKKLYLSNSKTFIKSMTMNNLSNTIVIINFKFYEDIIKIGINTIDNLLMVYILYSSNNEYEIQNMVKSTKHKLIPISCLKRISLRHIEVVN